MTQDRVASRVYGTITPRLITVVGWRTLGSMECDIRYRISEGRCVTNPKVLIDTGVELLSRVYSKEVQN